MTPRRIQTDESLAIALVKLWDEYDALCCNNDVVGRGGTVSDDDEQVIYMCLRPKGT
jgi:hypothetical protein